jgi:chemotaxis protein histidine kinase CheA
MPQHLNDYFALEAGEYLEQLGGLLSGAGQPELRELLRLARGVRGSAQMAGADTIAGVAERLEAAAGALLEQQLAWSQVVHRLAVRTVDDLKVLVRARGQWGPGEENRARDAIARWDTFEPAVPESETGARIVPISDLFFDDEGPHILSAAAAPPSDDTEVVPIESLLFRGESALREALAMRPVIEALIPEGGEASRTLRQELTELFDLVELGLPAEPRSD